MQLHPWPSGILTCTAKVQTAGKGGAYQGSIRSVTKLRSLVGQNEVVP